MEEGPWIFMDQGLILAEYDGFSPLESIPLNLIHAWVRIPKIPDLFRKKDVVTDLASRISKVVSVELRPAAAADYVRVRVKLDVWKPLIGFVSLEVEGSVNLRYRVLYEKIPKFCNVCGLMGHTYPECGDGVHPPESMQYGSWMLADIPWNRPRKPHQPEHVQQQGRGPGQRGGRSGGRSAGRAGRGRGGGVQAERETNRKRTSQEAALDGGGKTSSPAKTIMGQETEG